MNKNIVYYVIFLMTFPSYGMLVLKKNPLSFHKKKTLTYHQKRTAYSPNIQVENIKRRDARLTPIIEKIVSSNKPHTVLNELYHHLLSRKYISSEKLVLIHNVITNQQLSLSQEDRQGLDTVSFLLQNSRYADPLFDEPKTIIHRAVINNNENLLLNILPHILIDTIDKADSHNNTALYYATSTYKPFLAQYLLRYGACPNSRNTADKTPLIGVTTYAYSHLMNSGFFTLLERITDLLLTYLADPHLKDAYNKTAYDYICEAIDTIEKKHPTDEKNKNLRSDYVALLKKRFKEKYKE